MTLRVGIIGAGMIGEDHTRRLMTVVPGSSVVAIADVDTARADAVRAKYAPKAKIYASGRELIFSDSVDAIVVTSWGPTHEEHVLSAIAAGKPVFCEKPLATTQAACMRIIDAEVAFGRRLVQVGFMRRFDRGYQAMREVIASGRIGNPLMFHSAHRNPSVPASYTSDMALVDTAVHDIDVARFLLDDEVAAAQVIYPRRNTRGGALRDPAFAVLEMAGGAVVDIEISVNIAYAYDIRGEVIGETGTVELAEMNAVTVKSVGAFSGCVTADWRERFGAAFDAEFRAWIEASRSGAATGPSSWDGYAATTVTDAAIAAAATGERVAISMRGKPDLYR